MATAMAIMPARRWRTNPAFSESASFIAAPYDISGQPAALARCLILAHRAAWSRRDLSLSASVARAGPQRRTCSAEPTFGGPALRDERRRRLASAVRAMRAGMSAQRVRAPLGEPV